MAEALKSARQRRTDAPADEAKLPPRLPVARRRVARRNEEEAPAEAEVKG